MKSYLYMRRFRAPVNRRFSRRPSIIMVEIPPGLIYISGRLPRLVRVLGLAYAGSRIWAIVFDKPAPRWLVVSAYLFPIPLTMTCGILYTYIRDRRDAARRGAVLAPQVKSRWPGGFDVLLSIARGFRKGHIGSPFDQYCQEYGPTFNARIMFEDRIFTTEPEHIKAILTTQFSSFEKGPVLWDQLRALLGTGVFNSDGEIWKFHRSMTRPFFSKDRISHFDIFDKHAEDALNQAKARLQEGYPVDFQDMICRFTLDSATEFLFGKSVSSLSAGLVYPKHSQPGQNKDYTNHPANTFAQAFSAAQYRATYRGRFGTFWRLTEFWRDRVREEMQVCHRFIDPILKDALETKKSMGGEQSTGRVCSKERVDLEDTLLGHLVDCTEDPVVIRDEIVNILIAGRDTRLSAEVLTKVGSSRRPTYDDVREMKYMRAVINETLRLYAPVPFNVRASTEAAVWPGVNGGPPIYIPPKTRIPYSVFLMHRRKDLWGPDAEIFDPNRFLDERVKYLTSNPFIFLPFNAGPRIYIQTRPAACAKGTGRHSQEKVIIKHHLTLYADGGLWVRMGEAGDANNM
ncbi:cytochrome P450 [Pisolithus marmoratus]|nr:cytochrome P450 [Pisolithus marmoratus]